MGVSSSDRDVVLQRAAGMCEVCALAFNRPHLHHRRPRGMGGGGHNGPANLIAIHHSCHLYQVEQLRTQSYKNGWLVKQDQLPEDVPMLYRLTRWVLLSNDGRIEDVKK